MKSASIRSLKLSIPVGVAVLALFGSSSCTTVPRAEMLNPEHPDNLTVVDPEATYSYWNDEVGSGAISITIDLSEQTAYIYRGGTQIGRSRVATGRPGHSTPTGKFRIMEKKQEKRSNLYGQLLDANGVVVNYDADSRKNYPPRGGKFLGAPMPYWMRLTARGVGMHHGPIPNPGSTASHGCIRLPLHIAEAMFANVSIGTPVTIRY